MHYGITPTGEDPMPQKVTLKDIARETGLSESAVSQVLNNRPCRLSEESKERIRATAQRLNYRVNQVARSLAMRRSSTIGLIVPDIENPFFSSLAKRLEGCCREAGYGLLITNSDDRSDYDCEQLERLDSRGVDGIVFVPSNEIMDDEGRLMGVLSGLSVPYVMVDRVIEDAACDKVFVDNEWGAHQAVDYLIERGHTRIGCLARTARTQNGRLRLRGYENALAEHGIELLLYLAVKRYRDKHNRENHNGKKRHRHRENQSGGRVNRKCHNYRAENDYRGTQHQSEGEIDSRLNLINVARKPCYKCGRSRFVKL